MSAQNYTSEELVAIHERVARRHAEAALNVEISEEADYHVEKQKEALHAVTQFRKEIETGRSHMRDITRTACEIASLFCPRTNDMHREKGVVTAPFDHVVIEHTCRTRAAEAADPVERQMWLDAHESIEASHGW